VTMKITSKQKKIAALVLGLFLVASIVIYQVFLKVMICCPIGGGPCREIDRVTECKAPDLVSSCGCPSTSPDGGVECGC
jgi:hypothetical protein